MGQKDWPPRSEGTPIRLVRFTDRLLTEGVETHPVERVPVKVFGVASPSSQNNWPLASAVAVIMVALLVIPIALFHRYENREITEGSR